jgi:quercetin 2,3-dioxygenase
MRSTPPMRGAALAAASLLLAFGADAQPPAADRPEAFVVPPGSVLRHFQAPDRTSDFTEILAGRAQTGGALGLFRQTVSPGGGPPAHVHRAEDEFFYVVSGEFDFRLGDRVVRAPAHSVVFVPRGTAHTYRNVGTEPGVVLAGVVPGGFEAMFAELPRTDAADRQAVMERHHMTVVGPPLR